MLISPSILSADFAQLGSEISAIDAAGADWVHVDVMDGHFVPNITIGPLVVKAIRPYTAKPLDVHLMVGPVDPWIGPFRDAGADIITIHPESGPHPHRTLRAIRQSGAKAGVSLNPGTAVSAIEWLLDELDLVLVMSVNPGFGGQSFIDRQIAKVAAIQEMLLREGRSDIIIQVDGGVGMSNIGALAKAGARCVVAGTAVFSGGASMYAGNIERLRAAAAQ